MDVKALSLETGEAINFAIGWKGNYRIDDDAFVFIDRDTARVTTLLGYPTRRLYQLG